MLNFSGAVKIISFGHSKFQEDHQLNVIFSKVKRVLEERSGKES